MDSIEFQTILYYGFVWTLLENIDRITFRIWLYIKNFNMGIYLVIDEHAFYNVQSIYWHTHTANGIQIQQKRPEYCAVQHCISCTVCTWIRLICSLFEWPQNVFVLPLHCCKANDFGLEASCFVAGGAFSVGVLFCCYFSFFCRRNYFRLGFWLAYTH